MMPVRSAGEPGFPRKTCRQSAGAPCADLGTRGSGADSSGVPASLAAASYWAPGPAHPQLAKVWRKKTGRFFLDGKKKNLGSGLRLSPPPRPPPAFPADFVEESLPPSRSPRQERCPEGRQKAQNLRRVTF